MGSMIDAIKKRVSVRSYNEQLIEQDKLEIIRETMNSITKGPFGNSVRFELINLTEIETKQMKNFGTYGFINGATLYIATAAKKAPHGLEDTGYCFEKLILIATDLGLGTCWLGGTFKRASFANKIKVAEDEICPAISPLGYATKKRNVKDTAIRFFAKSGSRKPWEEIFFDGDFNTPLSLESAGELAIPLDCVRNAPSASNLQPWRITKTKGSNDCHLFLKRTKGYIKLLKSADLQLIDMGIAMCHFELASKESGLEGKWEISKPDIDANNLQYIVSWKASNP